MRLFEDTRYGQWGLVLLGAGEVEAATERMRTEWPEDSEVGDLVIGRFVGDLQLVVVRCDREATDFGRVLIALPLDPRERWPVVGQTLAEFLTTFVESGGDQYWPH